MGVKAMSAIRHNVVDKNSAIMNVEISKKQLLYEKDSFEFFATIEVDGRFFKQIGGVSNRDDLLKCVKSDPELIELRQALVLSNVSNRF